MNSGTRELTVFFVGSFVLTICAGLYLLWRMGSFTVASVVAAVSIGFFAAMYLSFSFFLRLKTKHPERYTDLRPVPYVRVPDPDGSRL